MKQRRRSHLIPLLLFALSATGCTRDFSSRFEKAKTAFEKHNYIEVIDTLNLALPHWKESDGKDERANAYELLGRAYHRLRKTDKAIEAYSQAVELSDNTFQAAKNLGSLYLSTNKPKLAIKNFRKALRVKKDDPLTLLQLGNAYYAVKDYDLAKAQYNRILDTSPGVRDALEYISLANKKVGQIKSSRKKKKGKH